jgi:hypothetical protein
MLQSYVNYSKNLITPNKNNLYITDEEYEVIIERLENVEITGKNAYNGDV